MAAPILDGSSQSARLTILPYLERGFHSGSLAVSKRLPIWLREGDTGSAQRIMNSDLPFGTRFHRVTLDILIESVL